MITKLVVPVPCVSTKDKPSDERLQHLRVHVVNRSPNLNRHRRVEGPSVHLRKYTDHGRGLTAI